MSFCTWIIRSERTRRCADSSSVKPRSRNTLPVEGVTLTLGSSGRFLAMLASSPSHQGAIPALGQVQVAFQGLRSSLLERMQHVDRLRKRRNVEDPVFKPRSNPDFAHARTDSQHRFPVVGFEPLLNPAKLKSGSSPSWTWEPPQVRPRRTKPEEALVRHAQVCKYSYTLSTIAGGRITTASSRPAARLRSERRARIERCAPPAAEAGRWADLMRNHQERPGGCGDDEA